MICPNCHGEFDRNAPAQKYCSKYCQGVSSQARFRAAHPGRSYEIKQKYRLAHHEQYTAYAAKYRETNPESPEKKAARHAIEHAIRDGKMTRGTYCSVCGSEGRMQAHHHNGYAPEHRLDVVWLCRKCHSVADREAKYDLAATA